MVGLIFPGQRRGLTEFGEDFLPELSEGVWFF